MGRRVSIFRAIYAPHFVVRSEDQEIGRFGSLGAAFEAARAAGGEISELRTALAGAMAFGRAARGL